MYEKVTFVCLPPFLQNQDSVNTDTVCRLYEVGRQRLAEEEEEDEEDQVLNLWHLLMHITLSL